MVEHTGCSIKQSELMIAAGKCAPSARKPSIWERWREDGRARLKAEHGHGSMGEEGAGGHLPQGSPAICRMQFREMLDGMRMDSVKSRATAVSMNYVSTATTWRARWGS
ncbi:hypothetical protein MPTK1_4g05470 [Marchantia polymorpha subsp. ruderalis]|uniref:Uncharacterized protein n=2 Tax=Marchantia polymorpha TaxID=3197 RepID=A0AAF6B6N3_MARPO|nr:hypothetical protein MARPO_0087s0043 [Marchantia polymorpha]BBN07667.1 hypothetical protein Mp_4g05470 [Marchantia polymorpha subsp. ruderalis]|eukprot:PTQ33605.1 hypothetical protein MARPO_0087s0043 [Marchantia polymorpha]